MLVIHHNDADGRCSAAIVLKWWSRRFPGQGILFKEVGYKDELNFPAIVEKNEKVVIVDFSFKPEKMAELFAVTDDVTWIDHHETAATYDYGRPIPGLRDFVDKGHAACELTWKHFFQKEPFPRAVLLIADYDAWRLEHEPECLQFYEGLKLEDQRPTSALWTDLLQPWGDVKASLRCKMLVQQGKTAIQYRDNYCAGIRKAFGYETAIAGHRAYAMNLYQFGSSAFGDRMSEYPVCIAYVHDGKRFTVSLYSVTVDVGEICRSLGGGGHKGAAGFVAESLPFVPASDRSRAREGRSARERGRAVAAGDFRQNMAEFREECIRDMAGFAAEVFGVDVAVLLPEAEKAHDEFMETLFRPTPGLRRAGEKGGCDA